MKHNNMRDDEARYTYEKIHKELARQAQKEEERRAQASDRRSAFFKRLISDVVDIHEVDPTEDKGTLTVVQTDGNFTIGEDDRLRPSPPNLDEGVPDDNYKARYEQAMELLFQALYIANEFSVENAAAHNIVLEIIRKKNELRDSE